MQLLKHICIRTGCQVRLQSVEHRVLVKPIQYSIIYSIAHCPARGPIPRQNDLVAILTSLRYPWPELVWENFSQRERATDGTDKKEETQVEPPALTGSSILLKLAVQPRCRQIESQTQ
jgi:hypothetical protein